MKTVYCFLVVLLSQQAICAVMRNPPLFSKPVYSNSYLPAAMQVIYHAVEQLKILQSEETTQSSTIITRPPSTSPITPTVQDQQTTTQKSQVITTSTTTQSLNKTEEEVPNTEEEASADKTEDSKIEETSEQNPEPSKLDELSKDEVEESKTDDDVQKTKPEKSKKEEEVKDKEESKVEKTSEDKMEDGKPGIGQESIEDSLSHQESPEVNEETAEINYATPETNYEVAEEVHGTQETNQEVPEENHEQIAPSYASTETKSEATTGPGNPVDSSTERGSIAAYEVKKKEPTIDSVVQDVYQILKPTPSKFVDDVEPSGESKSVLAFSVEKMESVEEEDDETRFTRLGEKVTQVPRPSLSSYLRRSKVPPSATLQQLASLYDSLSKDARKQGFGKYTGYSDEVLNTLETSAEGGIGPQLKKILAKLLERNELTREDARTRTSQAIRDLDNPSSVLSKELRRLLPLRYSP
ncbi:ecdysone-inducible gene E3 [Xylocopa sonorina]|uniref:ecdysone-inducible gene E3 n=1 Tax=Xylocopa sonorina TaxID=1818115 RepID=UPI00403A9C9E